MESKAFRIRNWNKLKCTWILISGNTCRLPCFLDIHLLCSTDYRLIHGSGSSAVASILIARRGALKDGDLEEAGHANAAAFGKGSVLRGQRRFCPEVICLEGSATHKTVETHTRGTVICANTCEISPSIQVPGSCFGSCRMYDYDDYNDNSSDSASNDDEDDSDPEPVVAPPGATMPASRNKNETVTEKFNMSFTKVDV